MTEQLIGFDARPPVDVLDRYWDAARRRTFLLRESAEGPLSVDPLVWPSLFDVGHGIGLAAEERARLGLAGRLGKKSALPEWIGPNRPLWEDPDALRSFLRAAGDAVVPRCVLIAVTVISEGKGPLPLDQGWKRIGYDVADSSFISGLSNCGYTTEESAELQPAWASRLNEHHLFEVPELASQFCLLTNGRVPEHEPFYVYGLYEVETLP